MKIGIITFHHVPNYGALLQALALYTFLVNRGHDVYIITNGFGYTRKYSLTSIILSRSLSAMIKKIQFNIEMKIVTEFRTNLKTISCTELRTEINSDIFDVLVVGSDQVWNFDWCLPFLHDVFLNFPYLNAKRLSYAASFGKKKLEGVKTEKVSKLLSKFDAISVREQSGVKIVAEISGQKAYWLPDPTLLFGSNFYSNLLHLSDSIPDKPFLCSYIRLDKSSEINLLEKFIMKELDLANIIDETDCDSSKCIINLLKLKRKRTVSSWLAGINGCSFVLTNSFHGVVFAIVFEKPFMVVPLHSSNAIKDERISSLLQRLNLSNRQCVSFERKNVLNILNTPINWNNVYACIQLWKDEARFFFEEQNL